MKYALFPPLSFSLLSLSPKVMALVLPKNFKLDRALHLPLEY